MKIFSAIVLATLSLNAFSQTWQMTNPPEGSIARMIGGFNHRLLISTAGDKIKYTDDLGLTWITVATNVQANAFVKLNNDLYMAATQGLYKSSDNGESWSPLQTGYFTTIAAYNGNVYVADLTSKKVYYSDGSITTPLCDLSAQPGGPFMWIAIDNSGTIMLASETKLLKSSTNAGLPFSEVSVPFTEIQTIIYDASGTFFLAETSGNFFRSPDNGQTWEQLNGNMPSYGEAQAIYADSYGNILYGWSDWFEGALLASSDKGDTWQDITDNLCDPDVAMPADVQQNDQGYYFVNCFKSNVFRSISAKTIVGVVELDPMEGIEITLSPNPTTDFCEMVIRNSKVTKGTMVLRSISGSLLSKEDIDINNRPFTLNLSTLEKGIYLVQVSTNAWQKFLRLTKI